MKKNIGKALSALLLMMVIFMAGCRDKVICDFCDEEKPCTEKEVMDEKVNICDNCLKELSE